MSFVIDDAITLAESWFEDTLDAAQCLIWTNEFIQQRISNKLWTESEKVYNAVVIPATNPVVAVSGSGSLTGTYKCKVTFVDADGAESQPNSGIVTVTADSDGQLDWSAIPVRDGCTRKLYRTKADGSIYYYLAAISDDSTTTYTDTKADSSLTVPMNIRTKYDLPTDFFRSVKAEDVATGAEYSGYKIRNRKIDFGINNDFILTYVPYPAALTATSGAGNEVPLPDVCKHPLAEFFVFKYNNIEIDDDDCKKAANEYEQRYLASLNKIYSDMEINSEGDSFQVKMKWS
jgi:hypothetical protein